MDEKKQIIRIIMMALVFILLFIGLVFDDVLGAQVVAVIRLVAVGIGIFCLGFYNKKLR